jgi:hypothetical protein
MVLVHIESVVVVLFIEPTGCYFFLSASQPETKSRVRMRSRWWWGGTPSLLCKFSLNNATHSVECELRSTTPPPETVLKWI